MREEFLFGYMVKDRQSLISLVANCPQDKRTLIPHGFNNNILWNLGHMVTLIDVLLYGVSGENLTLPEIYRTSFANGTRPADWTKEVPSWEEVIGHLKEQPGQVERTFAGKLNKPVKENFFKAETVSELLMANLMHERKHAGIINAMLKVLK